MNIHRHSRCHYKRNSGSTPAGTNNPPHRRACGMTNSRWLAAARSVRSDNDLRSGWLNSSSDDLRADAAATRPSPASPLEGRGQAIKAEEPEVSPRGGGGLVGGETFSGCRRLSADDKQSPAHRQIPTQVLPDGRAPTPTRRRRAGARTRQSKNTNVALAAYDVLDGPSVRTTQQPPVQRADSHTPLQRWEGAPKAAPEPAEPASQTRWS
jgi:hypothetical protein